MDWHAIEKIVIYIQVLLFTLLVGIAIPRQYITWGAAGYIIWVAVTVIIVFVYDPVTEKCEKA